MSDLTNLSEDARTLLIELLEKEQAHLSTGGSVPARSHSWDKSRRQEIIGQLLWQLRTAHPERLSTLIADGSLSRG